MALQMLDQIPRKHEAANDSRRVWSLRYRSCGSLSPIESIRRRFHGCLTRYELFQKLWQSVRIRALAHLPGHSRIQADERSRRRLPCLPCARAFRRRGQRNLDRRRRFVAGATTHPQNSSLPRRTACAPFRRSFRNSKCPYAPQCESAVGATLQEMQETRSAIADAQRAAGT